MASVSTPILHLSLTYCSHPSSCLSLCRVFLQSSLLNLTVVALAPAKGPHSKAWAGRQGLLGRPLAAPSSDGLPLAYLLSPAQATQASSKQAAAGPGRDAGSPGAALRCAVTKGTLASSGDAAAFEAPRRVPADTPRAPSAWGSEPLGTWLSWHLPQVRVRCLWNRATRRFKLCSCMALSHADPAGFPLLRVLCKSLACCILSRGVSCANTLQAAAEQSGHSLLPRCLVLCLWCGVPQAPGEVRAIPVADIRQWVVLEQRGAVAGPHPGRAQGRPALLRQAGAPGLHRLRQGHTCGGRSCSTSQDAPPPRQHPRLPSLGPRRPEAAFAPSARLAESTVAAATPAAERAPDSGAGARFHDSPGHFRRGSQLKAGA